MFHFFRRSVETVRWISRRWWALLPVCWIIACRGDDEHSRPLQTTVDTVNGIEHVRNTGSPPGWRARSVVLLGVAPNAALVADHEFGRITSVVGDGDGFIYVADASVPEVRVFDQRGQVIVRFGRRGSGPAEFRTLQSLGWLGDTLVVMDAGNARLGLLSPTGEWIGERAFRRITGDVRLHQTAADELYSPHLAVIGRRATRAFVRQSNAGPADTLVTPAEPPRRPAGVTCSHNSGGGISFWTVTFAPRQLRAPAPGGRLVDVYSADYRVAFLEPNGDTARVIERDLPRAP
ncbi:MAG TPA: hypothetical protein VK864_15995, partial [Longimicrobiales bacterium]|nr:hypothetical protein [Longimicrobiales bacterium]